MRRPANHLRERLEREQHVAVAHGVDATSVRSERNAERVALSSGVRRTVANDKVDVHSAYALGANSFITKPISQTEMNAFTRILSTYWFEVVTLPEDDDPDLLSP